MKAIGLDSFVRPLSFSAPIGAPLVAAAGGGVVRAERRVVARVAWREDKVGRGRELVCF